ncbi:MAG TPA: VWA domain-containing protein [Steroidobacteraceae bacterium]|nr:VWA domain-containing protein [Steroidobacteraceae bacterium]
MLRRRRTDTFGLSFLDCICCGFGAVILFYVMMSAQNGLRLVHRADDLRSEVNLLEREVTAGTLNLAELRNTLERTQSETASTAASAARLFAEVEQSRTALANADAENLARHSRVEELQTDVHALTEGKRRLEGGSAERAPPGQDVHAAAGSGPPRYITGLTLRGKRILILLDRSASMLHEDVVSVIRLRNLGDDAKRAASKWRRSVEVVNWLVTQMPAGSKYQVVGFNTTAAPLVPASAGSWIDAADAHAYALIMDSLHTIVPRDGTSLINAFSSVKTLTPQADQIILITDGLPTQGRTAGTRKYIEAGARMRLFDEAIAVLPERVPVDVVLLPMKGDVQAAHRFWRLARLTQGSLIAPSRDWP